MNKDKIEINYLTKNERIYIICYIKDKRKRGERRTDEKTKYDEKVNNSRFNNTNNSNDNRICANE